MTYRTKRYKSGVPKNRKLQLNCDRHGKIVDYTQSSNSNIYETLNKTESRVEYKCYRCLEEQIVEQERKLLRNVKIKFGVENSIIISKSAKKYNYAAAICMVMAFYGFLFVWSNGGSELATVNAIVFGLLTLLFVTVYKVKEKKAQVITDYIKRNPIICADDIVEKEAELVADFRIKRAHSKNEKMSFVFAQVDEMNGIEFEYFVKNLIQNNGYQNPRITVATADEGVDIIARKNGNKIAIQCKRYKGRITNKAVQEVFSGMHYHKCDKGCVITNSYFTENAINLARSHNVQLINRDGLFRLIEKSNGIIQNEQYQSKLDL